MEYILVLYEEKEYAKQLGAKWDGSSKKWYIPKHLNEYNKNQLRNQYSLNSITFLKGEDRNAGGDELFVDLIPKSCWFTNVRSCIDKRDWYRLRYYIFECVNYTCECCGVTPGINPEYVYVGSDKIKISNDSLEAHERWTYDENTLTQKLVRIIALCYDCHRATHIGMANIRGEYKHAFQHLKTIRNETDEQTRDHIDTAYKIWESRNIHNWNLDMSLITDNGIKIIDIPKINSNIKPGNFKLF